MPVPADPAACTYSGDPDTSLRDAVRFWVQDTDNSFWIFTDTEIDYISEWVITTTNSDPIWIASVVASVAAAKFTRELSVSSDGVSVDLGSLQQKYRDLAMTLRDMYDETHGDLELPSNILNIGQYDPTVPPLLFGIGMGDNFEAGNQEYGWRQYNPNNAGTQLEEYPS